MIHQPKPESIIEELHRIRREISDRFGGDISAIAEDAAERLVKSGRPMWKPKPDVGFSSPPASDGSQTRASSVPIRR
jgi:hypothetical protein